jgi:hypothetical protein
MIGIGHRELGRCHATRERRQAAAAGRGLASRLLLNATISLSGQPCPPGTCRAFLDV